MARISLRREEYTIGWLCALPIEKAAAIAALDGPQHEPPPLPRDDRNSYTFGRMGKHNVVIASMPLGEYGTTSAAVVAESMTRSFPLRFGLMVGIGGGAPSSSADIRLGDVVVGTSTIQYDYGKRTRDDQLIKTAFPKKPPPILLNALSTLQAHHISNGNEKLLGYLTGVISLRQSEFPFPGPDRDRLFESGYDHVAEQGTCALCDSRRRIARSSRTNGSPMVHYGVIASANQVMKHGTTRERLRKELDAICFDMEAAALTDHFRCLTIRGICDYSDSHKNKDWQPYASATAVAYAKELLSIIHPSEVDHLATMNPLSDKNFQDCLKSLSFPEMNNRNRTIERETDGTCAWLLDNPQYREWLDHQRGLLWLKGCPGAGKSTLLKYALQNEDQRDKSADPFVVSFFFHGRGTELEKDLKGFYRSVLYQLLNRFPNRNVRLPIAFTDQGRDKERLVHYTWSLAELRDLAEITVLDILQESPIRVFADALDECGRAAAGSLVKDFRRFLSKCERSLFGLSICFTCRHYPVICLNEGSTITVEQENWQDIQRHIRHEFDSRGLGNSESITELQETMQERSKGVFQWVALVAPRIVDNWLDGESRGAILQALRDIPQELNGIYEAIFQKLEHPSQSLKFFQWLIFAGRPLSIPELRWAMNVDARLDYHSLEEWMGLESYIEDDKHMERKVRSLSGGLASIVSSEAGHSSVQSIHLSVNDYLFSRGFQQLDSTFSSPEMIAGYSHTRLSRSCIAYMATNEVRKLLPLSRRSAQREYSYFPFLRYAYYEYIHHARKAENHGFGQGDLWDYLGMPSTQSEGYSSHPSSPPLIHHLNDGPTVIHLAFKYVLGSVLSCLVHEEHRLNDIDLNAKDDLEWTPLLWAVCYKDRDEFSELFFTSRLKKDPGNACYSAAFEKCCVSFVRLLLARRETDVNPQSNHPYSPLIFAIRSKNHAIVQLLLAREDINVNQRDRWRCTALTESVFCGNEAALQLLLAHKDIDVNIKATDGCTALITAIFWDKGHIARLLLSREDININLQDGFGRIALVAAVNKGQGHIVQLLLSREEIDINLQDASGQTALIVAADRNRGHIAQLLLSREEIDINLQDVMGQTALIVATYWNKRHIAQLLPPPEELDINLQDAKGQTALSVATDWNKRHVAQLLLSREDIDINLQDAKGRTALIVAVERANFPILQVLLTRQDVHVNVQTWDGRTAMTQAINQGADTIVRLLIQRKDIDLSVGNEDGYITNAIAALFKENWTIIRLLKAWEEARATDNSG